MFSRLAQFQQEAFQGSSNPHINYIEKQNTYFSALPNIILSDTPGLKGFDKAIQTVDTVGKQYQDYAVENPNDIFMSDVSSSLSSLARECAASDIDKLIASKNPSARIGCGWMYTPPNTGDSHAILSKGFVGTQDAALSAFNPPSHKKWFFDLQQAKKQMLIDKCKALKDCNAVDNADYHNICGFCTDNNQGIPINSNGQPLYDSDPRGNCSPASIILSSNKCPPPPTTGGLQPIVDKTCDLISGRLSADCLRRQVISAGCKESGALATALRGANSNDYIAAIRDSDSVKLYNRVTAPPLNMDIFRQGQTTVNAVLNEVRQLASNATKSIQTATGAAARDLCLQKGTFAQYDICSELSDGSSSPFDMKCLQVIFKKMGGLPVGTMYPSNENVSIYDSMGTLGAIKQYWTELITKMNSTDYQTQSDAMTKMLGIRPEKMIQRAPYTQGVEVLWFLPTQWGDITSVGAFLRRTIERDIVTFNAGPSMFAQLGGTTRGATLQMMDVRAQTDASIKFTVTVDDGFYITSNQPTTYDMTALTTRASDKPGHFANMNWQGPTTYASNGTYAAKTCTDYKATTPNVTKMYFVDGGGWMAFTVNTTACNGVSPFQSKMYSLTCEPHAPFLTYELNIKTGIFEELRNPAIFSRLMESTGYNAHIRTDERTGVPGKKGFIRMNSNSIIKINNIAYQSWKTLTVAMNFQTMPVRESIINLAMGGAFYFNVIATPVSGSRVGLSVQYNVGNGHQSMNTNSIIDLNRWTLFIIQNNGKGFQLQIYYIDYLISTKGNSAPGVSVNGPSQLYSLNGSWNSKTGLPSETRETCNVMIGSRGYRDNWTAMFATASFSYDLAWVHFFDRNLTADDIYREASANWIYTQCPTSYNTYNTLE